MLDEKIADLKSRLIVALDVPDAARAETMIAKLGDAVSFYKIGHQLAFCGGLELARDLKRDGRKVFLDLKLLDIDNTIAKGVESIAALGVDMLTIHAYPKAMAAAVSAASNSSVCLLAVTVLTSMDDADLADAGYALTATDMVARRARQASSAGMGGIVCSAQEAALVRSLVGREMAIVTPGIRPAGTEAGDQKRIMTPAKAMAAGATHLVVGRPVLEAADPAQTARDIVSEMAGAGI